MAAGTDGEGDVAMELSGGKLEAKRWLTWRGRATGVRRWWRSTGEASLYVRLHFPFGRVVRRHMDVFTLCLEKYFSGSKRLQLQVGENETKVCDVEIAWIFIFYFFQV